MALRQQEFKKADEHFGLALRCYKQLANFLKLGCVAHQLGVSFREQGRIPEALKLIDKASIIFLRKVKPQPKWDCYANAIFDMNLCYSKEKKFKESQEHLEKVREHVQHFPQDDQAKYFYNLALSQFKQGLALQAALGFGLSVSLLKGFIHANALFEHCPRGLVHLLANAHLNQAEALCQIVQGEDSSWDFAAAQRHVKDAAMLYEQKGSDIYIKLREQQRQQRLQRPSSSASQTSTPSQKGNVQGEMKVPMTHQDRMRVLMPPPPPRAPRGSTAARLKAKAQGAQDVKQRSLMFPRRMATGTGPGQRITYHSGLTVQIYGHGNTPKRPQQSDQKRSNSVHNGSNGGIELRMFIESLYKKAQELHLKASAALRTVIPAQDSKFATNSNLELAAFAIQQLVRIYHLTQQPQKSRELLNECQQLECLASNPRYQPHFRKWTKELMAMTPPSTE